MRSVTLTRMRRGALVLAAAAVMVGVRMFSAAPAMADPLVITEQPAQPVMNETISEHETIFDDGLGLTGLDNDIDFVNFDVDDSGLVSFDHDSDHADHANVDHDSDHARADNR